MPTLKGWPSFNKSLVSAYTKKNGSDQIKSEEKIKFPALSTHDLTQMEYSGEKSEVSNTQKTTTTPRTNTGSETFRFAWKYGSSDESMAVRRSHPGPQPVNDEFTSVVNGTLDTTTTCQIHLDIIHSEPASHPTTKAPRILHKVYCRCFKKTRRPTGLSVFLNFYLKRYYFRTRHPHLPENVLREFILETLH